MGVAYRKIHSLLSQEDGCTIEDLLLEEESTVCLCRADNAKLIEFICQKETLQKLIRYATKVPENQADRDATYK